ncbi:ftsH, partial [Symbiodinium pilosum]
RNLAEQRKAFIKETRDMEDLSFWGAQGIPGFAAHLKARFGSVLAGWRILDSAKKGRMSFHPFCKAARKCGYHGNVKKLWEELDATNKGFITLADIDPDVWNMVSAFKVELMQRYGDMLLAWQECIDVHGAGKVSEKEIGESLHELGLEMDARQLLKMFISMPGATHITLKDFDPRAYHRWQTSALPSLSQGDESTEAAMTDDKARSTRARGRLGVSTKEAFQAAMISQFGTLFRAWREGLDPTGRDRLSWGEFTHVFRLLGLHGDLQALWDELDTEGIGVVRFSDIDEETASLWSEMRSCFQEVYGNMLRAWMTGVDVEGIGHVDEDQFVAACKKAGFLKEAAAQTLFHLLRPPASGSFLSLRDFDRKAFKAFLSNDFRMLSVVA